MPPPADTPPPLRANGAPVLTLWAAVVAVRLGHPEETALTLGSAVAGTAARAKARRLGIAEDRPEDGGQRRREDAAEGSRAVRLLGREIPMSRSDGGVLLAAHEERPQSPASIRNYLARLWRPAGRGARRDGGAGGVAAAARTQQGRLPPIREFSA